MRRIAVLMMVVLGFGVAAGDPPGFNLFKSSDLRSIEQQVSKELNAQKIGSRQLGDYGTHTMLVFHMEASGQAELHENLTDIFVVLSGEANLAVGGKLVGGKPTGPGEIRGTSIEGGAIRSLAAGDVVNIPAGTPHQALLRPGQKITNFIIKVKAK